MEQATICQNMRRIGWMCSILAVFCLGMEIVLTPKPFGNAKIDDFAIARDTIADAKIIAKTNTAPRYPLPPSVNKVYKLHVNTSSGQTFYLQRPDEPGQLTHYLAVLPIGKEVSIRYLNDFDGHRILDVRDGYHIYIPFSQVIADENHKRNFMFIWTGIFALSGAIGFWFGRGKQKQHSISEHIQAHRK